MALDIIVPFWGDPSLLRLTVNSVLAQRNPDWLLTVVDDAYPDPSVREWFAGIEDSRVRYVRHETNVGITQNYRHCLSLATQDVVVLLGCDDLLLPGYVDVVLGGHARHPDAAVIQPGVEVVDEDGRVVRTLADEVKARLVKPRAGGATVLSGEPLLTSLLVGDWLYWPSLAFSRNAIQSLDFRDGFPVTQDILFVVDLVAQGEQLLLLPTVCFQYRRHRASASSTALLDGSRFAAERDYFAIAAQRARELGWSRAERAARWRLTSRAHALTLLPRALLERRWGAATTLTRHAFGS